ncbi:SCO2523 family variant P-loop protein [Nocardia vaccinii]|uniref:SCO2523 family variant P-loop protein n=1 Tax=Nocardia vaccinii TaxID=1822 RepID=UPI001FE21988|nr:SCO2523 family variant P-loop protein [Nocardia vaccinii]
MFSTSDKGGTGRSVTSCNLAYRLCRSGHTVAYVDFDFGSPTAGALFEISAVERGAEHSGVHSYLLGEHDAVTRVDVAAATDRPGLRRGPRLSRLMLLPGDQGGAEFLSPDKVIVERCARLLLELEQEFKVVIVDLSAGRSAALEIALRATAPPTSTGAASRTSRKVRWLVFHRWTRQHIIAASGLVHGKNGLLEMGEKYGHNPDELLDSVRYVRTAVSGKEARNSQQFPAQSAWLDEQDKALRQLANEKRLGMTAVLGETPMEPILQWREQIILDADVNAHIANPDTGKAYAELARRLVDPATWRRL